MPSLNLTSAQSESLHILSGSFRSLSLFLLAFSPARRTLSLVQHVPGFGPHQYVGTDRDKLRSIRGSPREKAEGFRAYTTSWATPPILSSWEITPQWTVNHLDNVPITAVSSYITLPPPYTHVYSMGGPTGEAHLVSPDSGSFAEKVQEVLFVPPEQLAEADKTRKALRYGSHGIEFAHLPGTELRLVFVPVLGGSTIEVYTHDPGSGLLTHVYSSPSPRGNSEDGPRHVKIHPNGKVLYCVTEHNNLLDAYSITGTNDPEEGTSTWTTNPLKHLGTRSLLPPRLSYPSAPLKTVHRFRGDTLMPGPSAGEGQPPTEIWATTRGATESDRGWVSVFMLDRDGMFVSSTPEDENEEGVERYETPTSGGKAHAIDLYPKSVVAVSSSGSTAINATVEGSPVWILLTDDSDHAAGEGPDSQGRPVGGVRVLEWDGWRNGGMREVAGWPPAEGQEADETGRLEGSRESLEGEKMRGGSHAVWLTLEEEWGLD
ncbi:hypothetical protein GYMLUDRAFT_172607 [Collybiopsis luxurians FD-317 M1]|uniref:Muconate cycloisomerase 1 n=1 Tax=Collybiopsis luxurians FD-317 M1 TaxID=944289 RepID=A0A0D0CH44_9AGAR|nr:hypothetical protein GYMLUDRAFT_172607 [Collybiopsis luxurians FD-317 M1]